MKHYTLIYTTVDNFAERRMPHREAHLKLVHAAKERGEIFMAGALGDPPTGALIIFRAEDSSVPENFARLDPYVTEGVVTKWEVRLWNVVVGGPQ